MFLGRRLVTGPRRRNTDEVVHGAPGHAIETRTQVTVCDHESGDIMERTAHHSTPGEPNRHPIAKGRCMEATVEPPEGSTPV